MIEHLDLLVGTIALFNLIDVKYTVGIQVFVKYYVKWKTKAKYRPMFLLARHSEINKVYAFNTEVIVTSGGRYEIYLSLP